MIVYCDAEDCKNNNNGMCENVWENGREAIALETRLIAMGMPICTDYEEVENDG